MDEYKGITRSNAPHIFSFIDFYHDIARDNYKDFLDDDIPLQKLVNRYYLKKRLFVILFNMTPYLIILGIYFANNT